MNYFETYAPVITWFAICLVMILALLYSYALCQIVFVQAYPQAPIETDMYMELPIGIETHHGNSKTMFFKFCQTCMAKNKLEEHGTATW